MLRMAVGFCVILIVSPQVFASPHWEPLQEAIVKAEVVKKRRVKKIHAQEALKLAKDCLHQDPKEAACYYYRGQAKGIYYGTNPIGYIKRVRSMLRDWKMALNLDPTFDHGGPYRMLAEVYRDLPKLFGPKDLRKDLKKAMQYIEKSLEISDYPRNHLDKTEIFLMSNRKEAARKQLERAKSVMVGWKDHPYHEAWQGTVKYFEKQLYK